MKKILLVAICVVVFISAFLLIFLTGNDKQPEVNGGDETSNENAKPFDYDLEEYITLGSFPSVSIEQSKVDELIKSVKDSIAKQHAENKEVTDRAVQNGDTVNIDYVGTMDGVAFEGGTDTGADLVIGSGSFIPGFEDGLIGKKLGEEVVLDLTFPENYYEDLAGKSVVFTVKINKITESVIPELTDAMIADLKSADYKTVEEFDSFINVLAKKNVIWQTYVESCKVIKHPEKEVNNIYNNIISNYESQAKYYGTTLDYLVSAMGYPSLAKFKELMMEEAKGSVEAEMVIYQTVRKYNITVSDEEYKTYALEFAETNGLTSVEEMEKQMDKEYIMLNVYQLKMIDMAYNA